MPVFLKFFGGQAGLFLEYGIENGFGIETTLVGKSDQGNGCIAGICQQFYKMTDPKPVDVGIEVLAQLFIQ